MAQIILPHRWRRQPQGPVWVDWSIGPISGVFLGGRGGGYFKFLRGGIVTPIGTQSLGSSAIGVGAEETSSTRIALHSNPDEIFGLSGGGFLITRVLRSAPGASNIYAVGAWDSSNVPIAQAHLPYSDGTVYWDFANGGSGGRTTAAGLSFIVGVPEVYVFSAGATRGREIWRDGRLVGNTTSATDTRTSNTIDTFYDNASFDGASGYACSIPLIATFNSEPSEALCRELSINPWQLFRPLQRRLYFPSAAAPTTYTRTPALDAIIAERRYGRPISDIAAGNWQASSGSDLYAMLDEISANDSDYIYSSASGTAIMRCTPLDLGAASTVKMRVRIPPSFTPAGSLTVALYQGNSPGSLVAQRVESPPSANNTYAYTLTSGEVAAITDGADLYWRVTSAGA